MKIKTLSKLLSDRESSRTVVLATNMHNGEERLIYPTKDDQNDFIIKSAIEAVHLDQSTTITTDTGPIFLHVFNPPLQMILIGAVHISQPLATMATLAGYQVTVVDPRRAFLSEERFPNINIRMEWPDEALQILAPNARTAVVALTHDPKLDDPALKIALQSKAFYIGALGSKKTHESRKKRMLESGIGSEDFRRIRGPVGLNIGAHSPSEIAVSILAEITQALRAEK